MKGGKQNLLSGWGVRNLDRILLCFCIGGLVVFTIQFHIEQKNAPPCPEMLHALGGAFYHEGNLEEAEACWLMVVNHRTIYPDYNYLITKNIEETAEYNLRTLYKERVMPKRGK